MKRPRKPVQGWLSALLIILPFVIITASSQMLALLVLGIKISDRHFQPDTFQLAVLEMFLLAGTFIIVGIFRRWVDRGSFRSLGFESTGLGRELFTGLWLGAAMISAGFVLLVALGEIAWVATNADVQKLFWSLVLFMAVALTEELIFRGYILNNLLRSMNRWVALLVSSLFFSLVHMGNANFTFLSFISIFLAGLLLGLPFIFNKRLWLPVALHFSWNFFQGPVFGFNVSGNNEYSLITQSRSADSMLNGGKFGFEGSICAVIFLSAAILLLGMYYRRKEQQVNLEISSESLLSAD